MTIDTSAADTLRLIEETAAHGMLSIYRRNDGHWWCETGRVCVKRKTFDGAVKAACAEFVKRKESGKV